MNLSAEKGRHDLPETKPAECKILPLVRINLYDSTPWEVTQARLSALSLVLPRSVPQSNLRLASAVGFVVLRLVMP